MRDAGCRCPAYVEGALNMINETCAVSDAVERDDIEGYADLVAALVICPSERAWTSVRAAWLFQIADALDMAGCAADAHATRERAMALVRSTIGRVADGEVPSGAI